MIIHKSASNLISKRRKRKRKRRKKEKEEEEKNKIMLISFHST
jgi:hypothetical protein